MEIQDLIERDEPGIVLLREWAEQPDANISQFLPRDLDLARRTLTLWPDMATVSSSRA